MRIAVLIVIYLQLNPLKSPQYLPKENRPGLPLDVPILKMCASVRWAKRIDAQEPGFE